MFILVWFDIWQFPSFWPCYAGIALWFKVFLKIFFILNMSPLCHMPSMFVWPMQKLSADFLSESGSFCWDCLVREYELSGNYANWFNVVTCSLSFYHMYYSPYFGILCLSLYLLLFYKFYIYICCKLCSEIKLLLTYFAATSGVTGLKPGQVRLWAYTLARTEKKIWLLYYISYNWYWSECEI